MVALQRTLERVYATAALAFALLHVCRVHHQAVVLIHVVPAAAPELPHYQENES